MFYAVVLVPACSAGSRFGPEVIDRAVADQSDAVDLTFEEAGFLVTGELIDIYGLDSDPVPVNVEGEIVTLDGQQVWRLDVTVDVTESGQRVSDAWQMWVGTPAEGPPDVLRARRRD
jgi:hypothetical protein